MTESNVSLFIPYSFSTSYSQFLSSPKKTISLIDSVDSFINKEIFNRFVYFHYEQVYLTKKKHNHIYELLFFSFGLLFSFLALLIFFKTTNASSHLYFTNGLVMKYYINYLCFFLSIGAFGISYFIKPEEEAMADLIYRVQRKFDSSSGSLPIDLFGN